MVPGLKNVRSRVANKEMWRKLSREGLGKKLMGGLETWVALMGKDSACLV